MHSNLDLNTPAVMYPLVKHNKPAMMYPLVKSHKFDGSEEETTLAHTINQA